MAQVDAERARLEAEITAANERAARARAALEAKVAVDEDRLGRVVLAAQDEIERLEREFDATIAATRSAALEEAARILEVARKESATVAASAAALASAGGTDDAPPPARPDTGTAGEVGRTSFEPREPGPGHASDEVSQ